MNGIENAKSAGLKITCNMVVNSQNIDDIIKTGQKMKELGISSFFVTPAQPPLNVEKYKSLLLTKNDILTIFEKIFLILFFKSELLKPGHPVSKNAHTRNRTWMPREAWCSRPVHYHYAM